MNDLVSDTQRSSNLGSTCRLMRVTPPGGHLPKEMSMILDCIQEYFKCLTSKENISCHMQDLLAQHRQTRSEKDEEEIDDTLGQRHEIKANRSRVGR
jgi:hypothetical protein